MADRVLPLVRLMIPCQKVEVSAAGAAVISNPLTSVVLPPGASFPFDL
jgi:hypothetical protein